MSGEYKRIVNAVKSWDTSTIRGMLDKGLNPNCRISEEGCSLLHFAVGNCDMDMVNYLLSKSADPNIRSWQLLSPVHLCAHWDFETPLMLLLKFGGDPYACDVSGRNCFDIASEKESLKCLSVLEDLPEPSNEMPVKNIPESFSCAEVRGNQSVLNQAFIKESYCQEPDLSSHYRFVAEGSINGVPCMEYIYEDMDENIVLKETRLSGRSCPSSATSSSSCSTTFTSLRKEKEQLSKSAPTKGVIPKQGLFQNPFLMDSRSSFMSSDQSHYYSLLSNSSIREQLIKLGRNPGPVTASTRNTYLKLLAKLKAPSLKTASNLKASKQERKTDPGLSDVSKVFGQVLQFSTTHNSCSRTFLFGYPEELRAIAVQSEITWQDHVLAIEKELVKDFEQPGIVWREGNQKTAFNYLLLDSRLTKDLPNRPLNSSEQMDSFIRAIFYIGKGSRSRPLSHLYEAAAAVKLPPRNVSAKVQKILDIWKSGCGVVNLYCFQNVIPAEAYTREALMIAALGLRNITNIRRGDCYGTASKWPFTKKRLFGSFLLRRALLILLYEGERQIRLADIHN